MSPVLDLVYTTGLVRVNTDIPLQDGYPAGSGYKGSIVFVIKLLESYSEYKEIQKRAAKRTKQIEEKERERAEMWEGEGK